jgi:hypothetical protein
MLNLVSAQGLKSRLDSRAESEEKLVPGLEGSAHCIQFVPLYILSPRDIDTHPNGT